MCPVTDILNGVSTAFAVKAPVQAVTTAPITLSGEQLVNGVAVLEGDRVLVKAQADATQNGIYNASATAWRRAADFDGERDATNGTLVTVFNDIAKGVVYQVVSDDDPIVIGRSEIEFMLRDDPAITYPPTQPEIDGGVTPTDHSFPPGDVRRYGAVPRSASDFGPALQKAVNQAINRGASVIIPPGTYRQTTCVVADDFKGLHISGYGATIDFRVDAPIKLGDHTVNGSRQFTQKTPTAFDIVIEGIKFKPGVNGWDGNRFAYGEPISLSAVENAVVRDCRFEDWDLAAVVINAPSKHVLVTHCYFAESEESDVAYGVRPFAHVDGMELVTYDATDGTLSETAPTVYHEDIVVRDCYFYQCSHAIVSSNVHGFSYLNNVIEKPTVRTISATNWSFDGLIQGNKHIVADNANETVSTCIAVGVGSQRIVIADEIFVGALSGTAPNDSMKVIDLTAVLEGIVVEHCVFDITNSSNVVLIGPNVQAEIRGNVFRRDPRGAVATIVINDQTASPVASPGFDQPQIRILGNVDHLSSRFVNLANDPPGTANAVVIEGNVLNTKLRDGLVATNTKVSGWTVRAKGNQFVGGTPTYCTDFGSGTTAFADADDFVLRGQASISAGTTAAVTFPVTLANTSYRIVLGRNANKTFWWTNKTTTGFTLNGSSSGSDAVDWQVIP